MVPTRKKADHFLEHHAYVAWAEFTGPTPDVQRVDVLKEDLRSGVYRLVTANPREPNIIVKRSSQDRILKESTAYARILPRVRAIFPRFHGCVDGGESGNSYLFVDEVRGEEYSSAAAGHRILAGEWLGRFHVDTAELIAEERHFERDPQYYKSHLRLAAETIRAHRSHPLLKEDDLQVLDAIVAQCTIVKRHWDELEDFCSESPQCYTHGDFKSDNVRVIPTPSGHGQLVVFDWASLALQTAAVDATKLFRQSFCKKPINADIHAYCAIARQRWPTMDVTHVRRLAYVGDIFRWAKAIRWAAEELRYEWTEQAIYLLKLYHCWMEEIIDVAPWKKTCVARDRLRMISL